MHDLVVRMDNTVRIVFTLRTYSRSDLVSRKRKRNLFLIPPPPLNGMNSKTKIVFIVFFFVFI